MFDKNQPGSQINALPVTHYQTLSVRGVLPARFFRKVRFAKNGCWIWLGSRWGHPKYPQHKYGQIRVGKLRKSTHVFAYEIVVGPIPQGKELDHTCEHKLCCNPHHLEAVTHQVNCARRSRRSA